MIDKIGFHSYSSVTMKQAVQKEDSTSVFNGRQSVVSKTNKDGVDALTSYGKSMFNMINKLDVLPIKAIDCKKDPAPFGAGSFLKVNRLISR